MVIKMKKKKYEQILKEIEPINKKIKQIEEDFLEFLETV